jgi:glyoxylate/hydroxypyruvate reductase A
MRILLHRADDSATAWVREFGALLPEAELVVWSEGAAVAPCDYAVLWSPPAAMVPELARVKAIFLTAAGADALLKFADALPPQIPIVRLGDAGMGVQMAEFVTHAVLRHFRRFDEYEAQARAGLWAPLPARDKREFTIGVLGMGVLGGRVLQALQPFGFPLLGWSRTPKTMAGIDCLHGDEGLDRLLRGSRVLVNMLPLTPDTSNLLDRHNLSKLPPGAYLINVARGAHVSEPDLLTLIKTGRIAGATLDVFRNEPLPAQHPFWQEPRITITPHISAMTLRHDSVQQIAGKIRQLEAGQPMADIVDRGRGY